MEGLDEGETAAIALAISLDADLLLMDERKGVVVARSKGLRVTGTLGVSTLPRNAGWLTLPWRSTVFGGQRLEFRKRFSIR